MDIEENNELTYQVCDIYKSSNKRVYYFCRSMVNHTRKNKDYYKKYIDNLLNNYRTNLSKDEIEKCFPTLDLISKQKPELSKKVEDFKKELETLPYFKDESGEWSPINKLNTNYSDISELISYVVEKHFKGKNSDFFFTKLINKRNGYQYLEDYKGDDVFVTSLKKQFDDNKHLTTDQFLALSVVVEDVINHDFFVKEGLEKVFSKNIKLNIDEIKTFVNNTIKNTYEGEMIENLMTMQKKNFWSFTIAGNIVLIGILGAIGSLIGAAVAKKKPFDPFSDIQAPIQDTQAND
jgi:hypothetical protein